MADIKSIRGRQSYFGALVYGKREFLLQAYNKADSQSTRAFIEYLRLEKKKQRIAIFRDGVGYYRRKEIREYLEEVSQGLR